MDLFHPNFPSSSFLHPTIFMEDMGEWKGENAGAKHECSDLGPSDEK